MGTYLTGLDLIGLYLVGLYLVGLYLVGLYLVGLYLMGIYLAGTTWRAATRHYIPAMSLRLFRARWHSSTDSRLSA